MKTLVDAAIVDVIDVAEYQGSVFERTIVINIDKSEIEVFDGMNVIEPTDIGSTIGLRLRAHLTQEIETVTDHELGISQESNRESKWSATIVGRVTSVAISDEVSNQNSDKLVLDVGSGDLDMILDNSDFDVTAFDINDTVRAYCGRLDVIGRE